MNQNQHPSSALESSLRLAKKIIPRRLFNALQPHYHKALARAGAILYGHPSRKLTVIAVTGTKGKSTTTEIINAILQQDGKKTALLNTIRFKIANGTERNLYKMTVPGRFFVQRFLRNALNAGCTHVVLEMSSEGAKLFRHVGVEFNALVFLNLAPEHLESHGGMEQYAAAKLSLADHLLRSPKRPRTLVANADDAYGPEFLKRPVELRLPFSLRDAEPYTADESGSRFFWRGNLTSSPLPGAFNLQNTIAAMTLCEALGISYDVMRRGIEGLTVIPGRGERIDCGQPFTVVVDYAHTPDSLRAIYQAFPARKTTRAKDGTVTAAGRRICVLGSTGGGRDTWKRGAMGKIADEFCTVAFLTDEDPYDEDPETIIEDVAKGFSRISPHLILDRRLAIRSALQEAQDGDVVLITGKGTDPCIMRQGGVKEPWSDREVAEKELNRLRGKREAHSDEKNAVA